MKILISIFFLLSLMISQGQIIKTIKIINGATGDPVEGMYCSIIKNADKHVGISKTDKNGIATFKIHQYKKDSWELQYLASKNYVPEELWDDSTANYDLLISEDHFNKLLKPLKVFSNTEEIFTLFPNKDFKEKNPALIYMGCSSRGFGTYEPKIPSSIYDLPDTIRDKLVSHLIDRLGNDFYRKITLTSGQMVNLSRLYLVESRAKNYKWIPYSYYLCFSFKDEAKGIGLYTAKIILDSAGNVVQEIELPDIKSNPEKAIILPLEKIRLIAKQNGFDNSLKNIKLDYAKNAGSIAWYFDKVTDDNGLSFNIKTLIIDAHNGKLIDITNGSGIR